MPFFPKNREFQNIPRLWFRAKRYGWGWYPATVEGWAVTVGYVVIFITAEVLFLNRVAAQPAWYDIAGYFLFIFTLTGILIRICYAKGEEPRWRWSEDDPKSG